MAVDFSKFDKSMDLEGLKKDIEESANSDFKEVDNGTYEVAITKLELTESKKGNPMLSCWMKVVSDGPFKGSLIFMNQVVTSGFQIHICDEFLRSLGTDVDVKFESYSQYADMILDIFEKVDGKFEYGLEYGETDKGFKTYKITEVFELD